MTFMAMALMLCSCATYQLDQVLTGDDFEYAARKMVTSVLSSGRLRKNPNNPQERYIMATGQIVNDTMMRFDTDLIMTKIEEELTNSGQVIMTSAVGHGGARDNMVYEMREMRGDDEFNQGTVAKKGKLLLPEFSVSGKIIQRALAVTSSKKMYEYYFQLRITNIENGLTFWQKEVRVTKQGENTKY